MGMRIDDDLWKVIRYEWETDHEITLRALAERHGINFSTISKKAKTEGWKRLKTLSEINELAHKKADALAALVSPSSTTEPIESTKSTGNQQTDRRVEIIRQSESVDIRAEINARHRDEWLELEGFRKTALLAMKNAHKSGNKDGWAIAKTAADTAKSNMAVLEIKQNGERRAWGLDVMQQETGNGIKIVIERKPENT